MIKKVQVKILNSKIDVKSYKSILREKDLDDFWILIEGNGWRYVFHLLIRYMAERVQFRDRWVGALQEAKIPLRFINGLADPISGAHMAQHYKELIPNPDVVPLEDIGHFPLIESPHEVLIHFLVFVGEDI